MKKNINFIILLLLLILLKKINHNIFNNYNDILKYISIIIILVSSFYFVIKLNDMDSDFLNEYKENHPDLNPDDYR